MKTAEKLTPGAVYVPYITGSGMNVAVHFPRFLQVNDVDANKIADECKQAIAGVLGKYWFQEQRVSRTTLSAALMETALSAIDSMKVDLKCAPSAEPIGRNLNMLTFQHRSEQKPERKEGESAVPPLVQAAS